MKEIKSFKELGVTAPEPKSFIGEKIAMKKILGKLITVHDFKTGPSKYAGTRLDIQITYDKEKRVVWTSSAYLKETIERIPKESLPFTTTIIEDNDRFVFT